MCTLSVALGDCVVRVSISDVSSIRDSNSLVLVSVVVRKYLTSPVGR